MKRPGYTQEYYNHYNRKRHNELYELEICSSFVVRFHCFVVVVVVVVFGVRHFSLFELQHWNHYLESE